MLLKEKDFKLSKEEFYENFIYEPLIRLFLETVKFSDLKFEDKFFDIWLNYGTIGFMNQEKMLNIIETDELKTFYITVKDLINYCKKSTLEEFIKQSLKLQAYEITIDNAKPFDNLQHFVNWWKEVFDYYDTF